MLAGVMAAVLAPVALLASPASAAPEPYTLTMSEGQLTIRDSEPTALEDPTTITGTNDGGNLSGGTLSTPTIEFERAVTEPLPTTANIAVDFSLITPDSMTGSIDEDRNVTLSARLRADMEIRVALLPDEVYTCAIQPVDLVLTGVHDEATDNVDLVDDNFSIPAAPVTDTCPDFIANALNSNLQGSGHAIAMSMTGPLTAPLAPGDPTTTTLSVTPAGPVEFGDAVTLDATVAPADGEGDTPGGFVEFTDGSTILGTVELDEGGAAQLVTTDISAGTRQITARYTGTAPIYDKSSDTKTLVVQADPMVVSDLPPAIEVGGAPVDFEVTATNTGFGRDIPNARIDVTIQRADGSGAIGPAGANPRLVLSTVDEGGTATPIALTASGSGFNARLSGSIGGAGVPLPVGQSWETALRLQVNANMGVGPLRITFDLVEIDGDGVILDTLATGSDEIEMVGADRMNTTLTAGYAGIPGVIPPIPAIGPARVRAGNTVAVDRITVGPQVGGVGPTGTLRFSIDGRPLLTRVPTSNEWSDGVPSTLRQAIVAIPADITGPRQIAITYGGDVRYRPATASYPVTIEPALGPAYECTAVGTHTGKYRANLEASAVLPAAAAPGATGMDALRLRLNFARGTDSLVLFSEINADYADPEISVSFGDAGSATAGSVEEFNNTAMAPDGTGPVDHSVALRGLDGELDIAGAPGDVVDVPVESLVFEYTEGFRGARNTTTCVPVTDALEIGSVTVAGTTLEVTPEAVGVGDEVTLKATVVPALSGTVEFLDGDTTVGVAPVVNGVATTTTHSLGGVGERQLTAVFRRSSPPALMLTSAPEGILVVGTCSPIESGNGAAVRLVYIELLDRCADTAGYSYWKGQLDAGTVTLERFAQQISDSPEARGVIVDDAYEMMLERAADAAGRAYWVTWLGENGRYDELLAQLGSSPEFRQLAGGSDEDIVTRIYERILGRSPSAGDVQYWVDVLDRRGPQALVKTLFNLPEPLGVVVTDAYEDLLDRAPTSEETTAGSAALKANSDRSALYASIIGTPGFVERAQSFPEMV